MMMLIVVEVVLLSLTWHQQYILYFITEHTNDVATPKKKIQKEYFCVVKKSWGYDFMLVVTNLKFVQWLSK